MNTQLFLLLIQFLTSSRCIGLWDAVGSIYNDIEALKIKDTNLPTTVDVALHAVSLQENRREFRPALWTVPANGLESDQVFKQVSDRALEPSVVADVSKVWFPGSHTDVGGSYHEHRELVDLTWFPGTQGNVGGSQKRHELADISLFWMVVGQLASEQSRSH